MNRSKSNTTRTQIKKSAITRASIRKTNVLLGPLGKRLCKYTGELLDLNATNFHKLRSDPFGFQSISKLGHQLYRDGQLEVKSEDRQYLEHDSEVVTTA